MSLRERLGASASAFAPLNDPAAEVTAPLTQVMPPR